MKNLPLDKTVANNTINICIPVELVYISTTVLEGRIKSTSTGVDSTNKSKALKFDSIEKI